jgi:hypothetical protein
MNPLQTIRIIERIGSAAPRFGQGNSGPLSGVDDLNFTGITIGTKLKQTAIKEGNYGGIRTSRINSHHRLGI